MSDQMEFERQLKDNQRYYDEHRDEIRSKYAGQYIGIAFGRLIATDRDFHKVCEIVDALVPSPEHVAVFAADDEPEMDAYMENLSVELE